MHPADANEKKYPAHQSTSWWCARGNENQFSRCEGQKNKCLPTISRPRLLSGRANNIAAGTNPCARSLAFCLSKKQQIRTKVGNLIFYIKCHTQPHNARHKVYIEQRAPLSEFIFSCTTLSFVARKLQLLLGADNIAFFCTRRAAINLTRYEKTQ